MMDSKGFDMMGYGGGFGMFFVPLLLISLVIFMIYFISKSESRSTSKNAINILNERFARGEIDQNEYDSKRKLIDN